MAVRQVVFRPQAAGRPPEGAVGSGQGSGSGAAFGSSVHWAPSDSVFHMLYVYAKSEQGDHTRSNHGLQPTPTWWIDEAVTRLGRARHVQ